MKCCLTPMGRSVTTSNRHEKPPASFWSVSSSTAMFLSHTLATSAGLSPRVTTRKITLPCWSLSRPSCMSGSSPLVSSSKPLAQTWWARIHAPSLSSLTWSLSTSLLTSSSWRAAAVRGAFLCEGEALSLGAFVVRRNAAVMEGMRGAGSMSRMPLDSIDLRVLGGWSLTLMGATRQSSRHDRHSRGRWMQLIRPYWTQSATP
mmetsp:Transcript_851/g.1905  ORF Transcript_851/g.1905 Transcript_851/m.1905 type:complete len:203 (-) Transcript_851:1107-1715(-)